MQREKLQERDDHHKVELNAKGKVLVLECV